MRLLYLACAHPVLSALCCVVLGRAVLAVSPGPPAVEDMFSVCLTQCIFNELRSSGVFHSMGLNDASVKTYRLHIVLAVGPIHNNVTTENYGRVHSPSYWSQILKGVIRRYRGLVLTLNQSFLFYFLHINCS